MGLLNGHDVSIFPDSGSDLNVIPSGVLEGLIEKGVKMTIQPPNRATNLLMANGHTVGVKRVTWLKLTVDLVDKLNTTRTVSFCVLEGASVTEKDVILGRPLMRQLGKQPQPARRDAPCFEVAFTTADVPQALEQAVSSGAALVQAPAQMPWGQTTAYVADLDGFLIEICTPVNVSP